MKCNICEINEATVHLTEVVNDEVTKMHLCEECAKSKSQEMQSHFGLSDLLSGLVDLEPIVTEEEMGAEIGLKCPNCGMTYYDFQSTGKLGCGRCYEAFEPNLSELLIKIHGSDKHVGKMPIKGEKVLKEQQDFQRLKNELTKLIRAEEFEKAALLRDRIKDLAGQLNGEEGDDEDQ